MRKTGSAQVTGSLGRKPLAARNDVRLLSIALVLAFGLLLLPGAAAQLYTGSISGTVTDPSGAVIPSAHVNATDQNKGFAFTATTDASGRYLLRPIPPGRYRMSVDASNFQGQRKEEVTVEVNQNVSVDFSLKVGAANEVVDVEAGAVQLQTQDAVTGQVVDRRLINNLPLINRDFLSLAYLAPGVTDVDTQCVGCMANNFVSNGSRGATADILLDGASATNFEQNSGIVAPTYLPSVDAVEEFKVQQSNFSAEYGFSGATVINVITRSGTNQFHGSAYEFLRNDKLDANDWFNNFNGDPRQPLRQNNFGFTIGGPIRKNKTFFFFDYDATRQRTFASANAGVPTATERTGDFGELCTLRGAGFDGAGQCTDPAGQLWDPYSSDPALGVPVRSTFIPFNNLATFQSAGNPKLAGTPFQPAAVPGNLIDPVALKLMQMFPMPTQSSGTFNDLASNWFGSGVNRSSNNQFDVKVDHRFSERDLLSVKYSQQWGNSHNFDCFQNAADPCTGGPVDSTAHLVAINETHTFAPNLLLNVSKGSRGDSLSRKEFRAISRDWIR
jgi:Carboxypeptidase regulatory-like domain